MTKLERQYKKALKRLSKFYRLNLSRGLQWSNKHIKKEIKAWHRVNSQSSWLASDGRRAP